MPLTNCCSGVELPNVFNFGLSDPFETGVPCECLYGSYTGNYNSTLDKWLGTGVTSCTGNVVDFDFRCRQTGVAHRWFLDVKCANVTESILVPENAVTCEPFGITFNHTFGSNFTCCPNAKIHFDIWGYE